MFILWAGLMSVTLIVGKVRHSAAADHQPRLLAFSIWRIDWSAKKITVMQSFLE
jgi:hypothetical protein